jgi:hypothetical protein
MEQVKTNHSTADQGFKTVALQLDADQLSTFFPVFQSGVTVPAKVGCTLKNLLTDQFAIPADYVADRITTIFLDNSPVDDLDSLIIRDGSRLTLSAAMPGLVGATMRRGGFYAALRQGISYEADKGVTAGKYGSVRLKLFNLLLAELGPLVLARGLLFKRQELAELLQNIPESPEVSLDDSERILLIVSFKD